MKHPINMYDIFWTGAICLLLSLFGCSAGTSETNSSGSSANPQITIDNAGIVPVFTGSSTNSLIYVHNNTNKTITGINYSIINHTQDSTNSFGIDTSNCDTIAPHTRCAVKFTTPVVSGSTDIQGSAVLTAQYEDNTFSQIISYRQISDNSKFGILIESEVSIYSSNNTKEYATVYAYSGAGQNYIVSSISVNNPYIEIIDNYTNLPVDRNTVIPIEISSYKNISSALLNFNALTNYGSFTTHVNVAANTSGSGAVLISGLSPIINIGVTQAGSFSVVNAGNESLTFGTISYPANITASTGSGACGTVLAPYASCTIYFNINGTNSNTSGVNISIPYTYNSGSGSLTQLVSWYNVITSPILSMVANPYTLKIITSLGSAQTMISVYNVGTIPVNLTTPTPVVVNGNATASISFDNCNNTTLAVESTCTYVLTINDATVESNKQISVGINGSYTVNGVNASFSRSLAINYTTQAVGYAYGYSYFSTSISKYIESSNGTLSVSGTISQGDTVLNIVFSPGNGNFGYACLQHSGVRKVSFDPSNGSLTNGSTYTAGDTPVVSSFDITGQYLYTVNRLSLSVSMFQFNSTTGDLTALSPASIGTQSNPSGIATSFLSKRYVYVVNLSSNSISMYLESNNGVLTPLSPATLSLGASPTGLINFHPSGKFVYVGIKPNIVRVYSLNKSTGALTLSGSTSSGPTSSSLNGMAIDPSGRFAYLLLSGTPANTYMYSINQATGLLTALSPSVISCSSVVDPGPQRIVSDLSGQYVYTADAYTTCEYKIDPSTGQLSLIGYLSADYALVFN